MSHSGIHCPSKEGSHSQLLMWMLNARAFGRTLLPELSVESFDFPVKGSPSGDYLEGGFVDSYTRHHLVNFVAQLGRPPFGRRKPTSRCRDFAESSASSPLVSRVSRAILPSPPQELICSAYPGRPGDCRARNWALLERSRALVDFY